MSSMNAQSKISKSFYWKGTIAKSMKLVRNFKLSFPIFEKLKKVLVIVFYELKYYHVILYCKKFSKIFIKNRIRFSELNLGYFYYC